MTRLGYQIPNFTYPDTQPADLFKRVIAQAVEAEQSGFDRVLVMDHFYQLPGLGAPEEPMLECYTVLSALAQHTSTVRLAALVTGNTYRNPTLLAKTITALDHVSGGRATLGIGAGWFELEHDQLGYEFGTFTERFRKLEEALQIIGPMLGGEPVTFNGEYYRTDAAVNSPAPLGNIPIMIGGAEEDAAHGRSICRRVEPARHLHRGHRAKARRPRRPLRAARTRPHGDQGHEIGHGPRGSHHGGG